MGEGKGRPPTGEGVPQPIETVDTGELVTGILEHVRDVGNMNPVHPPPVPSGRRRRRPGLTAEVMVSMLAEKAAAAALGPDQKKYLGMSKPEIIKFAVAFVATLGTAYLGIKAAINDNSAAVQRLDERVKEHSTMPTHPGAETRLREADKRLDGIDRKTDQIEVRQEVILEGISDIKDQIRTTRPRRR